MRSHSSTKKRSVYEVITARILELLDRGTVPWRKPWRSADDAPRSLITKRPYRGVNIFLLNAAGFESPYWLTYRQASGMGGHIRRGEKGWPVVFWKWLEKPNRDDPDKTDRIPLLRYYTCFNMSQCEDLPDDKIPTPVEPGPEFCPIAEAEAVVRGMPSPPEIRHGGGRACYWPSLDRVDMPQRSQFIGAPQFYSVLFHEMSHATGHPSRLNRKNLTDAVPFGSASYSQEELLAEMSAAFLMGHCGLVDSTIENTAAYVNGWQKRLRDDSKLVVMAAAQAQKAADFILDRKPESDHQD